MSAVARCLAVLVVSAAVLTGCGDATDNPAPSETAPTASSDVTSTTAPADTDAQTATQRPTAAPTTAATASAPDPSSGATGTAAPSAPIPAPQPAEPSSPPQPSAPTSAPASAPTVPSDCTGDALSEDILGFPGGVSVYFCDGDWAYAAYPNAPGAPEFIAERVDGRWFHAVTIGDPVCKDDLTSRGAPPAIAKLLPDCEEPAPTAPPTTPPPTEPPTPDCVISTNLYGDTVADLIAVTCGDATAEWELAEANADPSWNVPWITPTGWECYVSPYDPESKAAGACYAPEGNAQFTLYVQ